MTSVAGGEFPGYVTKHYIQYIMMTIVFLTMIFHPACEGNKNIAFRGSEVAGLSEATYIEGNLYIQLITASPAVRDEITGKPKGMLSAASEWIYIFGDGRVFSKRYFIEGWVEEYFPDEFELDDSWECNREHRPVYVTRRTEYRMSSDQIKGLLEILGTKEDEMLPGPGVMNHRYYSSLRILYDGREGYLVEPRYIGIEDEDNVLIIEAMLKSVREIESEVEFDEVNSSYFGRHLNEKKKEFGWYVRSILEPEHFMGVDSAQAAF